MKRKIAGILATTGLAFTTLAAAPTPAQAATYGWVYLSFPSWQGNCPGSTVKAVQADVSGVWSTNWDYGDDIVYGKVRLGQNNTLNYNLQCHKYGRIVGYQAGSVTIRPTRNNQTVWSGPSGVRYN